ncbi:type IIA DNA topoisomerase subunit B [Thioalkalivibrio sp. ALE16]|uniref:DNA gyrase/topoisomerase IV subunit B n=1 Tax=Thioalkalivibrio sp. ALE16 TaxID=1158172 RepID=UPI0003644659|nr:toprim domain-containing protein [Thioalkalivibrio sp. ALE16]
MNETVSTYNSSSIQVLEGLEPVRKRPGMYIGGTDSAGLRHIFYEIIDNAVDEAIGGHGDRIEMVFHADGSYSVSDNGRGIPIDMHTEKGMHAAALLVTTLHAGGKFDNEAYKFSGGLHGVGSAVTNALSTEFQMDIRRDGKRYTQRFVNGGEPEQPEIQPYKGQDTGTHIRFWPDLRYFDDDAEVDFETVAERLKKTAYLAPGLTLLLRAEARADEPAREVEYCFGAFSEILDDLAGKSGAALTETLSTSSEEAVEAEGDVEVSIALRWHERAGVVTGFANIIPTSDGTHITGMKTSIKRAVETYAQNNNMLRANQSLSTDDVMAGLVGAVAVRLGNPTFAGQTKEKLKNPPINGVVSRATRDLIDRVFEENPQIAKAIVERAKLEQKKREAADKAAELVVSRKSVISATALPGKLADCQEQDPAKSELFIVEGDSAGGSAKQGREREFQAILPLKGKILNTYRADPARIIKSEEVKNLVLALGCGPKTEFNIDNLRYHKIIILADADSDGAHIACLALTFFHVYAPDLIENGYVYVALPPLYRVRKGKTSHYLKDDKELQAFLDSQADSDKWSVQRFKGLGEMNPDQLWEAAMDPATRRIGQIHYSEDGGRKADDPVFETLMGSEVPPRREFIERGAERARLDL